MVQSFTNTRLILEFTGTIETSIHIDDWIYKYRLIIISLYSSEYECCDSVIVPAFEFAAKKYTAKIYGYDSIQWGSCRIETTGNSSEDIGEGTTYCLNRTSANTYKISVYGIICTRYILY